MRERLRPLLLVLAAVVFVASACATGEDQRGSGTSPTTAAPTPDAPAGPAGGLVTDTPFPDPSVWEPAPATWTACGGLDCAEVEVPLDWARPGGGSITLALLRRPATGARLGTLFVNPGGPGGSGVAFVRNGGRLFGPELRERFDIVGWDPRGVGRSEGLTCGGDTVERYLRLDPSPDTDAEAGALDDAARAIAEECGRTDRRLLPHVATPDVARDLEALRIAVGDDSLSYLGFSYGTAIGQWYAHLFPDRIRAMVLDAVMDPADGFTTWLEGQAEGFTAALEGMDRACAARRCPVPILEAASDLSASVEDSPLPAGDGEVGPAEFGLALVSAAYTQGNEQRLSDALAAGIRGDGAPLDALAREYTELTGFASYAAVVCVDAPTPRGGEAFSNWADTMIERWPLVGATVANELRACAHWPVPNRSVPRPIDAAGAPPLLLIANEGDPATPYAGAVRVARRLSAARLITVEGDGHTAYGSTACVTDAVHRYLVELEPPRQDLRCTP